MKVPQYSPSQVARTLQRRILTVLLVATAAIVLGLVSFPPLWRTYQLSRLDDAEPAKRLAALNVLVKSAVGDADLHDRVEQAFRDGLAEDSVQATVVLVRLGTWAVLNVPTFNERFVAGLDTDNDAVFRGLAAALREAGRWGGSMISLPHQCRWYVLRCAQDDPALRADAVRALAHIGPAAEPHLVGALLRNLKHPAPGVRLAAVEAISICLPKSRKQLLQQALDDHDDAVRREAALRLELLDRGPRELEPPAPLPLNDLIQKLHQDDYYAQLQAIAQISRTAKPTNDARAVVLEALRDVAEQGLRTGNGGLAGSALEAIAHLGDRRYLPLMLDVAAGFADQPMLRFVAARAAAKLDAESGGQALVNLFGQDSDVVRDLAAVAVSRLDDPAVVDRLRSELFSTELEVRGPAALALALRNQPNLIVRDMTLGELLVQRTTLIQGNVHAEPEWKPRGYYLCSRLILGDESVRGELEVFEVNEHFPRIAIHVAFLHAGDTSPLDLILGDTGQANPRAMDVLRDMRFGELIARYVPDAPLINWHDPPAQRAVQMERLAKWWTIYRWNLVFDVKVRRYRIGGL